MNIVFTLLLAVFLAFSGYHLTFRRLPLPLAGQALYLTGTEFLFLGLLLGPLYLNVMSPAIQQRLESFTGLLLGVVGLMTGLQFDLGRLRRFSGAFKGAVLLESLVTAGVVMVGITPLLGFIRPVPPALPAMALFMAAILSGTGPTAIALVAPGMAATYRDRLRLLRFIAGLDGVISLAFLGLACVARTVLSIPDGAPSFFPAAMAALAGPVMAGAGLSLFFILYLSLRRDAEELVLILVGMAVLGSGVALLLDFSPLVLNFVTGVCLVNLSRERERLLDRLLVVEKPVYLLLLLLLGSVWRPDTPAHWLIGAGLAVTRLAGKMAGGWLVRHVVPGMKAMPPLLGFGLMGAGGLPMAMALDFRQRAVQGELAGLIAVALAAILASDLVSPYLLNRLLHPDGSSGDAPDPEIFDPSDGGPSGPEGRE